MTLDNNLGRKATHKPRKHGQRHAHLWDGVNLALTVVVDVLIVASGAYLLWIYAGPTVVSGPILGRGACFVAGTALLAVRVCLVAAAAERAPDDSGRALRFGYVILGSHLFVLTALVMTWNNTQNYLLGWFACFAATFLVVGSWWQLIATVATTRSRPLILLRATEMLAGAVGVIFTQTIHGWGSSIIESIALIASAEILLSTMILYWFKALRSVPIPNVQPAAAASNATGTDGVNLGEKTMVVDTRMTIDMSRQNP